ncbi:BhlA/UviB family holin-like peptide [Romboutsia sp.]|uniref:BhlA/UviB family holin-like peptide n=1 Tax=Romboutsia sp. TaxID=1965302 RepID=UPI002CF5F6ED|nr:BhlA/UviB family holin-like peptide [Romboutsia sp.]HSQ90163.1 BhlA/UviB family holin-like peptide [Romboutsia sp.]
MDIITGNMENITFATLFVGLFVYTLKDRDRREALIMKQSDKRESLMREQLNKTVPILDGILRRLDGIENVISIKREERDEE